MGDEVFYEFGIFILFCLVECLENCFFMLFVFFLFVSCNIGKISRREVE